MLRKRRNGFPRVSKKEARGWYSTSLMARNAHSNENTKLTKLCQTVQFRQQPQPNFLIITLSPNSSFFRQIRQRFGALLARSYLFTGTISSTTSAEISPESSLSTKFPDWQILSIPSKSSTRLRQICHYCYLASWCPFTILRFFSSSRFLRAFSRTKRCTGFLIHLIYAF